MPDDNHNTSHVRPWWTGKEGVGLWIGVVCNLLVFAYIGLVLLPSSQHKVPIGGDGLAHLLMLPVFFLIFPFPILPLLGMYWSRCDTQLGSDKKVSNQGEWGLLFCLVAPVFLLVFSFFFERLRF